MSFSAEMKDFFSAFQTTSGVIDSAKQRKMAREKLDLLREANPTLDDLDEGYGGPQALDTSFLSDDDNSSDDNGASDETAEDIEIPPVIDPAEEQGKRKVYGPGGTSAYYAGGGSVKTGTQPGRQPVDMSNMNKDLMNRWKKVQQQFGRDLNVVSGFRDAKRNKRAGGAKKSQHMHGNAIDIDVSGLSRPERLELIKLASANGMTGIGVYNNSLHFDVGNRRAWGPSYKNESVPKWARGAVDQHLSGKFGDYSPEATYAGKETALPVATEEASMPEAPAGKPDWRSRLQDAFSAPRQAALPVDNGQENDPMLDAFYNNDGMDIGAIDVPRPGIYRAADLTETPEPVAYAAAGGTVPWAGQTSYVNRRRGPMGSYFQRRPYTPRYSAPTAPGDGDRDNNSGADKNSGIYAIRYLASFGGLMGGGDRSNAAKGSGGSGGGGYRMAAGGTVPGEEDEYDVAPGKGDIKALPVDGFIPKRPAPAVGREPGPSPASGKSDLPANASPDRGDIEALPVDGFTPRRPAPAINREPGPSPASGKGDLSSSVTLGDAIDLGLKHLTRSLALDEVGAAVGPDPGLSDRRKKLIKGEVADNEPPPTPQEIDQVFETVDPNGELNDSLRTVYAMRKGVEFYLKRGDQAKAAKWAASLIQYSNLVSRQYGIEAVKAAKAGDTEGMVKLAVKSYDAIPDGMSVSAKLNNGAVAVTRTDEEGNVVDTHQLTPQQVFQMATGISQGSGYFDALMSVAGAKSGKKGASPEQTKLRMDALRSRFSSVAEYSTDGDKKAFEQALAAGDWQTANDIIRDAGAGRPKPEPALTPGQIATQKSKDALAGVYAGLLPDIEAEMTEPEKKAWQAATEASQPNALKDLYDNVKSRLSKKEQETLKVKKVAGLKELRGDYEADLSPAQKKALDAAFVENDVTVIDRIYDAVDKRRGDDKRAADADERFNKRQQAINDRIAQRETAAEKTRREKEEADAQKADAKAKQDAINAAKLKPIEPRDLEQIEGDVNDTIRSLFTTDEDVDSEEIPKYVDEAVGPGAYNRIRSLAINIAGYNRTTVEDSFSFMTDILTDPNNVSFSNDPAGNLLVDTPSGQFKLPQSERKKIDGLMGAGISIDDGVFSGYGYNVTKTRKSGGVQPEEAIPTSPAPTSAGNAGRQTPSEVSTEVIARKTLNGVSYEKRADGKWYRSE